MTDRIPPNSPQSTDAASVQEKPPAELYDHDEGVQHWLRKDLYPTAALAKTAARGEIDAEWTEMRCETVWARLDAERVAEDEADGIPEPYDGWPWTECRRDDPGAVAYWRVYIKGRA